jgi:predicted PurR-regulated permease PerM
LERLRGAIMRITRDRTQHILDLVGNTIKGVIYGIVGTALAQSLIAGLGFWIAGVPMPFLLGLFTFFAALIPMGPPFIWIPASIWLFMNDHMGWGIFMIIYGALGISSIDNILRPYLISYSSKMPFIIVFLGALGGAIGFGFLGVFLGPALLAVGFSLLKDWGNLTAKTALSGSDKIAKSLDKGSSNTVT